MTRKLFLAIVITIASTTFVLAQSDSSTHQQKTEQYVGVQANELIRQIFNFSNTNNTITNPYLLTYALYFKKLDFGIRTGLGYTYNSNTTNDGVTKTTSNLNDLSFRIGVERIFKLSRRFTSGVGIDGIIGINDDKTTTAVHSFDTTTTVTTSKSNTYGGGAMAWLRYNINKKISIGSEVNFYYTTATPEQTISVTTRNNNLPGRPIVTTTTTSDGDVQSDAHITIPAVIYLVVRF